MSDNENLTPPEAIKDYWRALRSVFARIVYSHREPSGSQHRLELGIEFLVELLLFLYPFGAEQMNLPHNFWLGLGSWAVRIVIAIRIFWILPWTEGISNTAKAVVSCFVILVFTLSVWKPVSTAFKNQRSEPTTITEPSKQEPGPSASEIADEVAKKLPQPTLPPKSNSQPKKQSSQPSQGKNASIEAPQRPYELIGDRRKKFLELLEKAQSEPRDTLRIGCISWSDAACVAAGRFLILFSEAGWTIDSNRVFRMDPAIPIDGMAMVSHIDNIDDAQKLPPHLGVWQKMDASQITIWWAFKDMGIPVSPSSDQSLPLGTLGIYFGPEPQAQ